MASSSARRTSQIPLRNANLYCAQCESQIGIFENEWIRLTSSYARSKARGMHFGTEVGLRTQTVPSGVAQKSAAGCEMADVFCRKCSQVVGQYCKTAPNADNQFMLDQYFYKLSRTYLKDAQTAQRVEPEFGYSGEIVPPPAKRQRLSHVPSPRGSRPPLLTDWTPRASIGALGQSAFLRASRRSSLRPDAREESVLSERLMELEQRITDHDMTLAEQDSSILTPVSRPSIAQQIESEKQEAIIEEQRSQISALTGQIETLRTTIDDLRDLIQDLRGKEKPGSEEGLQTLMPLHNPDFMSSFETMVKAVREAHANSEDIELLRQENEELRGRLNNNSKMMHQALESMPNGVVGDDKTSEQDINQGAVSNTQTRGEGRSVQPHLKLSRNKRQRTQEEGDLPTPASSRQSSDGESYHPLDRSAQGGPIQTSGRSQRNEIMVSEQPANLQTQSRPGSHLSSDEGLNVATLEQETTNPRFEKQAEPQDLSQARAEEHKPADATHTRDVVEFSDDEGHDEPTVHFPTVTYVQKPQTPVGSATDILKKAGLQAASTRPPTAWCYPPAPTNYKYTDSRGVNVSSVPRPYNDQQRSSAQHQPMTTANQIGSGNAIQQSMPPASVNAPLLHQPAAGLPTPDSYGTPNQTTATHPEPSSRPEGQDGPNAGAEMDNVTVLTPWDIARQLAGYKEPKPPKIPKERIQTTEKRLRAELRELGLEEWIGKPHMSREYREAVGAARMKVRNENKALFLATVGLRAPSEAADSGKAGGGNVSSIPKAPAGSKRGKHSVARKSVASGTEVLKDVTNNAPKPRPVGRPRKNQTSGEENVDEELGEETIATSKPKASKGHRKSAPMKATIEKATKRGLGRKSLASAELVQAHEDDVVDESGPEGSEDKVLTRAQQRQVEIRKRDQMAKEAMDAMEVE